MEKPNLNNESRRLEHRLKERFVKAMATYHLIRAKIDHPRFSVEALHVRMENIQYETDTSYLQQFCDEQGVKLHLRTTRFEIGEETVNDARDARRQKQPCFLCSWMRRKEMFNLAQELGCNKIALGHHQDDMLHTALMNLTFQGRFDTMPARLRMRKMPLTIIRPLCLIEEADIKAYAEMKGYQKQKKICPYETNSHRTDIKRLYDEIEQINPEARYSIWRALNAENKLIEE